MIRVGCNTLLYPFLYRETEDEGSIDVGDGVVISLVVHIAARAGIAIGAGTMIGEYTNIRDANHARIVGLGVCDSGELRTVVLLHFHCLSTPADLETGFQVAPLPLSVDWKNYRLNVLSVRGLIESVNCNRHTLARKSQSRFSTKVRRL